MPLNKVAKKWVAALRSGKYKQTRQRLGRDSGSRCCLGVLCDLAVKAKVIDDYNMNDGVLPFEVVNWVGLSTQMGDYVSRRKNQNRDLTEDNDISKKSFAKIADIIESQPEGLFAE